MPCWYNSHENLEITNVPTKKDEILQLLEYAESLRDRIDRFGRQTQTISFLGATVVCLVICWAVWIGLAMQNRLAANGAIGAACVVAAFLTSWASVIVRSASRSRRAEVHVLEKVAGILREYLPRAYAIGEIGLFEKTEIEIRISMLPVGKMDEWSQSAEMLPVTFDFHEVPWDTLIRGTNRLVIYVAYARTWRNRTREYLKAFLGREGTQLTVILPSPQDNALMQQLAERFSLSVAEITKRIKESIQEFDELGIGNGKVEVLTTSVAPQCTYYLFDNSAVVTFYSHTREKKAVPIIFATNPSRMYQFAVEELDSIRINSTPIPPSKSMFLPKSAP